MLSLHSQVMAGLCRPKVGVGVGNVLRIARIKLCSTFANMGMFSIDEYVQVFQQKITQNHLDGLLTPEIPKIPTWNPPMSAMSTKKNPSTPLGDFRHTIRDPFKLTRESSRHRTHQVRGADGVSWQVWLGKFLGLNTSGSPNGQRIWAQT